MAKKTNLLRNYADYHACASSKDIKRTPTVSGEVSYNLGNGCKLVISGGDITKWQINGQTDAIVNAAHETLTGGGGVDGFIHSAAGPELLRACLKFPLVGGGERCPPGEAVLTEGFNLPVSKVIHTVGPRYRPEAAKAAKVALENSYKNSLLLAFKEGVTHVAFSAISCGVFHFPLEEAADIALSICKTHCKGFTEIHFVLFNPPTWCAWERAAQTHGLFQVIPAKSTVSSKAKHKKK